MKVRHFVELNAVKVGENYGLGWYVGAGLIMVGYCNFYLHDDGNIYEGCFDEYKPNTTGWFPSKAKATKAANEYYRKYGLVYPHDAGANVVKSKPMVFK